MIHTIVHTWKKLAVPVAFLAFFLLLGVTQASAQSLGHRTAPNPESHLAQKFGVAAYNMGTWNAGNVAQILIANTPAVKDQTNAPLNSRVTYAYYQLVIPTLTFKHCSGSCTADEPSKGTRAVQIFCSYGKQFVSLGYLQLDDRFVLSIYFPLFFTFYQR